MLAVAGILVLAAMGWASRADAKGHSKDKWREIANVEVTEANAREVGASGNISKIRFEVYEGSVVFNTGVVRQGAAKTGFTVGRRLAAGSHVDVDVGPLEGVTGIRVSEDGQGKYRIYVQ